MAAKKATDEQIGQLCANVVNRFAGPNVNARTMLQTPQYWTALVKALRGEEEEGATATVEPAAPEVPEAPQLTSVEPNRVETDGDDVKVTLRGTAFTPDSVIVLDGNELATEMKSAGELNTIVEPSLHEAGIVEVKVKTGDRETTPLSFTFAEPSMLEEDPPSRRRGKK